MTTTFAKFANAKRANYSDLPKIDVEILADERHCEKCGEAVRYESAAGRFGMGDWVHVEEQADGHSASPRTWCKYCHNDDSESVRYRQHAWYDAVECDRCGGVDGYAIGD